MERVSSFDCEFSAQSLSRSYAHAVMHSYESLFLDQNCTGVALFSGWLPSFRRESSDLRHTCPQSEASFLARSSESGMLRSQSRDFGRKQCSAQAEHIYRRRKIPESLSTNFAWPSKSASWPAAAYSGYFSRWSLGQRKPERNRCCAPGR